MLRPPIFLVVLWYLGWGLGSGATAWGQCTLPEEQKLMPRGDVDADELGASVAVDGLLAVVGAPEDLHTGGNATGAGYVFRYESPSWVQEPGKLIASDGADGDDFGASVSVSGNLIVVGAPGVGAAATGAAYVYRYNGTACVEEQKLTASDGGAFARFGSSVSANGNVVVVGAWGEGAGAAYVYRYSGTTWVEEQKLTASDAATGDRFGTSVAVEGAMAVVGASFDDHAAGTDVGSAYVFRHDGSVWVEEQKLIPPDTNSSVQFGNAVSTSGDLILVGAYRDTPFVGSQQGSAYVFRYSGRNWIQEQKLTAADAGDQDAFGWSISVQGSLAVVGARGDDHAGGSDAGSAYVFRYSGTSWIQEQKLIASDAAAGDSSGASVALDGSVVLVGAPLEDHEPAVDAGAVYAFQYDGTTWSEEQKLTASDYVSEGDRFGHSVAIDGTVAVVGAHLDHHGDRDNAGSAYVFRFDGTAWTLEQKLIASDAAQGDRLGVAVAVSGDVVVVGADGDDHAGGTDAGAAYVFRYDGSNWIEEQKLIASDAAAGDTLGTSVAVSGDVVLVGANRDDHAGGSDAGSAYVFRHNGSSWIQEQKLIASDAAAGDRFGASMSVSGPVVLVGADGDDPGGIQDAGAAYVFRHNGINWTQEQKLIASDRGTFDYFGAAVSMSGNLVVVGASFSGTGSAYVFRHGGSSWIEEQKLTASDAAPGDAFGDSVSVSGEGILVGASLDDHAGGSDAGAAYLFRHDGTAWVEKEKLTATDAAAGDFLGTSVALSGSVALVGAPLDDQVGGNNSGAVYTFELSPVVWVDFAYVGPETGCFDQPYNTLAEGISAVPAGGLLRIKTGATTEKPTISQAMTIEAYGGPVIIGQ